MPTRADILETITDVTVSVLECPPEAVVPDARFSELGSDSLTIVEIGEELGRRFGVRLSDDSIDTMRTVQDAVNAVVDLAPGDDPVAAPGPAAVVAAPAASDGRSAGDADVTPHDIAAAARFSPPPHVKRKTVGFVTAFLVVGVLVGGLVGFGLSAVVSATGIDDVSLPPLPTASPSPTPEDTEPTEEPAPEPTATPTEDEPEEPSLTAEQTQVAPGQRFVLSGAFPAVGSGTELQVQVREDGTDWDDFPITTTTRDEGAFKTELFTSRPGEREFRLIDTESGDTTPTVTVTIG